MQIKNVIAFTTVIGMAALTAGAAFGAITAVGTVAMVAYTVLGITGSALSIASITAWASPYSTDTSSYFKSVFSHAGIAIGAIYTFVAQTLIHAIIQGIANGIGRRISRRIGGADLTVS